MLKIRPFIDGDADTVAGWPENERVFRMWSANKYKCCPIAGADITSLYASMGKSMRAYTAYDERGIAGHITVRDTDGTGRIMRFGFIIVDPARRGEGIGRQMVSQLLDKVSREPGVERITLGVYEENAPARALYKSLGFAEADIQPAAIDIMGEKWRFVENEWLVSPQTAG